MSDAELLVSEGGESKNGEFIFDRLPAWMPSHNGTGNFKLLDVVGRSFDRIEGDMRDVDNATTVQEAETVEQIREISRILNLPPKEGEDLNKYRTRSISEFQTLTSEGTASDLIGNTATLLDTKSENIGYQKLDENGVVKLGVPVAALDDLSITGSELVEIIANHCAAGFRVEVSKKGTFTYITPTDYNNNNHDASKGYDGLDSNGDPKNNGGTYAGLI